MAILDEGGAEWYSPPPRRNPPANPSGEPEMPNEKKILGSQPDWTTKVHKHFWQHTAFIPKNNGVCEVLTCTYCKKNVYRTLSEIGDNE